MISWGRLLRVGPARLLLAAFLPFLSLCFSPFSHFTHLQPDGLLMDVESQVQLSDLVKSSLTDAKSLQNIFSSGNSLLIYRTAFAWSQLQYRKRQWQRAYRSRPPALETQAKRQRQKHAQHWQLLTRAQFPGGRFPAKFGCQPIKLELYPMEHAYSAINVRVHFRHLRVYKESPVAYRAIRVRVS